MSGAWKNEGEGSRSGAKAYDDAAKDFADSGRVRAAADKAMVAREGAERADLDRAEAEGRSHSKGEDPAPRAMGQPVQDSATDFESALVNPADHFADPTDVINNRSLSRTQKRQILRQWELDARQLSVAEEENMTGGEASMVGRVSRAILALGGDNNAEGGVTKLG